MPSPLRAWKRSYKRLEESASEQVWTVRKILAWTAEHFEKSGVPSARLNAEILLAEVLSLPARLELLLDPERKLSESERASYREYVKRRSSREPTAHILGCWSFYKRDFSLSAEVLTPRSETELVADRAISWARENGAKLAADIGTGSGCLAVTLAVEIPALHVTAVDISAAALQIARSNAEKHGVAERVEFLEGDLLEPLRTRNPEPETLDLVVSNPPYIPSREVEKLMPEIANHEPRTALDGGQDGLDFYRRLAPECARLLRPGGALVLEIGAGQGGAVIEIFEATAEYAGVEVNEDLNDLERVFFATRK
jgi:release factor glutamine methyltransferase